MQEQSHRGIRISKGWPRDIRGSRGSASAAVIAETSSATGSPKHESVTRENAIRMSSTYLYSSDRGGQWPTASEPEHFRFVSFVVEGVDRSSPVGLLESCSTLELRADAAAGLSGRSFQATRQSESA